MLKVTANIQIPLKEFDFSFARSPGPGGQNVNKVNSKAILKWKVSQSKHLPEGVKRRFLEKYKRRIAKSGELVISSHRYRDQGRNVADCLSRLREMIESVRVAPRVRKKTKPSKASKQRRLDGKKRKSATKKNRRSIRSDD